MAHFFTMMRIAFEVVRLRRHERWNRADIIAHQAREFEKLRRYVYRNSPFYRQFHARLFDAPLHAAFPIDARHSEELPDDVVRGLRRYGLRYLVARVPRTEETTFAGPGWDGCEVFRFSAARYPDIVGYTANNPAVR